MLDSSSLYYFNLYNLIKKIIVLFNQSKPIKILLYLVFLVYNIYFSWLWKYINKPCTTSFQFYSPSSPSTPALPIASHASPAPSFAWPATKDLNCPSMEHVSQGRMFLNVSYFKIRTTVSIANPPSEPSMEPASNYTMGA